MKWVWKILAWIANFIGSLLREKGSEQSSKEDSKKIDEADNKIEDKPVNPAERTDADVFNNEGWNPPAGN